MNMRDEIAAIYAQCDEIAAIREELEAGAHPFDDDRERAEWEADQAGILEYESWHAAKAAADVAAMQKQK